MISHKTLGHPATLFGLAVVSFIIGLKGTMLIDDAVRADHAVEGVQMAQPSPAPAGPTEGFRSGPSMPPEVFVGVWGERWGDVALNDNLYIHAEFHNGVPHITKLNGWSVYDVRYSNGVLTFNAYDGATSRDYAYWVVYNPEDPYRLDLRVVDVRNNRFFEGLLRRTHLDAPPPPSDYIDSSPQGVVGGVPGGVVGGLQEAPARQGPVRVSGGELMGNLIDRVEPVYSPVARQARVQGAVVLEVMVDEYGEVASARVLSGHPMLTQAAVEAVNQWIFEPTYDANDEPVEVIGTVTVNFNLGSSATTEPPAPPQPQAATSLAVPAPEGLQGFVGTWSAKWADVSEPKAITISIVNGQPLVTQAGGWSVSQESFDGRVLSFYTRGGGSNWAFRYYLEYAGPNRLKLRVHRVHDNRDFAGEFTK